MTSPDDSRTAIALVRAAINNDRHAIDALLPPGQPVSYQLAREIVLASGIPGRCIKDMYGIDSTAFLAGIPDAIAEAEARGAYNPPDEI